MGESIGDLAERFGREEALAWIERRPLPQLVKDVAFYPKKWVNMVAHLRAFYRKNWNRPEIDRLEDLYSSAFGSLFSAAFTATVRNEWEANITSNPAWPQQPAKSFEEADSRATAGSLAAV